MPVVTLDPGEIVCTRGERRRWIALGFIVGALSMLTGGIVLAGAL